MPKAPSKKRAPGRPTTEDREKLRWAILEAASREFSARSYEDVSMDTIAEAANTSKQSIYARFPTKAALFTAFMAWRFQTGPAERLEAPQEQDCEPSVYLEKLGVLLMQSNTGQEAAKTAEHLRTVLRHTPELAQSLWDIGPGRGRNALRKYLQRQADQGVLVIPEVETAMEQLLGMLVGGAAFRMFRGMPPLHTSKNEQQEWVSNCVQLFLSFYKP